MNKRTGRALEMADGTTKIKMKILFQKGNHRKSMNFKLIGGYTMNWICQHTSWTDLQNL